MFLLRMIFNTLPHARFCLYSWPQRECWQRTRACREEATLLPYVNTFKFLLPLLLIIYMGEGDNLLKIKRDKEESEKPPLLEVTHNSPPKAGSFWQWRGGRLSIIVLGQVEKQEHAGQPGYMAVLPATRASANTPHTVTETQSGTWGPALLSQQLTADIFYIS